MTRKHFRIAIALLAYLALFHASSTSALPVCGRDEVFDLSGFEPLPFGGEIIGAIIAEGEVVGTHFEITFTTSGNFDAADLGLTLVMPILPDHLGFTALGFTGADAGWSGHGTFTYSIDTDALNGTLSLDGDHWATWYIDVSNLNPGGGPISGNFDVWRYEMQWAPCPSGDTNCDTTVTPADIPHFVEALLNPDAYEANHEDCSIITADVNTDGSIDGRDVHFFGALVG